MVIYFKILTHGISGEEVGVITPKAYNSVGLTEGQSYTYKVFAVGKKITNFHFIKGGRAILYLRSRVPGILGVRECKYFFQERRNEECKKVEKLISRC